MRTILISYDLGSPETSTDYQDLIKHIKSYSSWAKPLESFWLVKTNLLAEEVRNAAKIHIDSNDKLIVLDVTGDGGAWFNLPSDAAKWIKENL